MTRACGIGLLAVLWSLGASGGAELQLAIPNASFEIDYEADGEPDGWQLHADTRVQLVPRVTHGAKAAKFTDGYVLLTLDQQGENVAGSTWRVAFDAAGEGGAKLGAIVGYMHRQEDGPAKFQLHTLTWDRPLADHYTRQLLNIRFADDAVDGRVWFSIYRSNKQGAIYLDNFTQQIGELGDDDALAIRRLSRDFAYVREQCNAAAARLGDPATLAPVRRALDSVIDRALQMDGSLIDERGALVALRRAQAAVIHRHLAGDVPFAATWSSAVTRLEPAAVMPAKRQRETNVLMLRDAYGALGLTVWNTQATPQTLRLSIDAALPVEVRRQVLLENWYEKHKTLIADALPLLARDGDAWLLPLEAGGAVKLYIGFHSGADAGRLPLQLRIRGQGDFAVEHRAVIEVLDASLAQAPTLEHMQFIYPNLSPADKHPELTAKEMAACGVTGMEFPYVPPATYDRKGNVIDTAFDKSRNAQWMRAYGPHIKKMFIFWEGAMANDKLIDVEGNAIEPYDENGDFTPAFINAYSQLLSAWLAFARSQGFGDEHWGILPDDEPKSGLDWARAPGPEVLRAIELYRVTRRIEPNVAIYLTMSDYAMAADLKAMLPHLDVVAPVYPFRTALTRHAPPNYNPRQTFDDVVYPLLDEARNRGAVKLWSYAVNRGKRAEVLQEVMAYPVNAVARGFDGVGYWAFNVTRGLSWDDTDGGTLDYSFIYDGTEDHPLNHQTNVTGEIVVPSIRWRALRLGLQDARLLLAMRDRDPALRARAARFGAEGDYTQQDYDAFAIALRRAYADQRD